MSLVSLSSVVNKQQGKEEGLAVLDVDPDKRLAFNMERMSNNPCCAGQMCVDPAITADRETVVLSAICSAGSFKVSKSGRGARDSSAAAR